jgi:hypothetical protein
LTRIDSVAALDRYVDYTLSEYNHLFWETLYPVATPYLGSAQATNAFYLQFALSSIRAHPTPYLRHVAAHFYGLWRDLGHVEPLKIASIAIRAEPGAVDILLRNQTPASVLAPYPEPMQLKTERVTQEALPLAFEVIWNRHWIRPALTIALGILALGLSFLFLVPGRLAWMFRTEIMIALTLNAYFSGHALLQVSLSRYADVGILAAFMLAVSFMTTSLGALRWQRERTAVGVTSESQSRAAARCQGKKASRAEAQVNAASLATDNVGQSDNLRQLRLS